LAITKNAQPIETPTLYRTLIGIWNAGTVPIEPSSIRQVRHALTIEFRHGTILDASIVQQSNTIMGAKVTGDEKSLEINWDHFDPSYYLILSVYHYLDDISRPSLRYIGDQEILESVSVNVRHDRLFLSLMVGIVVIISLSIVRVNKIGKKIDASLTKFKIFEGLFTLIASIIFLFGLGLLFNNISVVRSILRTTVPSEVYRTLSVDEMPPNP
jgi:hypothetical protein